MMKMMMIIKKYNNFRAAAIFVLSETDLTAHKAKENLDHVVQVGRQPPSHFHV